MHPKRNIGETLILLNNLSSGIKFGTVKKSKILKASSQVVCILYFSNTLQDWGIPGGSGKGLGGKGGGVFVEVSRFYTCGLQPN